MKALISIRHDPFTCFPDPQAQKEALDKIDLLVSVDTHYSEFGWYSDVILPESTFLERESIIATQKEAQPYFIKRNKVIEPLHDTKSLYEIVKQLADRLGVGRYFPGNSIEEMWAWQLEPTGFTLEDFEPTGFVTLADRQDRDRECQSGRAGDRVIEALREPRQASERSFPPGVRPFAGPCPQPHDQ